MNEDFKLVNLFSCLMISCRSTQPEIGLGLRKSSSGNKYLCSNVIARIFFFFWGGCLFLFLTLKVTKSHLCT